MKILILTRFYFNGQSTHVFALCKGLIEQGHSPYLVISNLHCQNYTRWLRSNRIRFSSKMEISFLSKLIINNNFDLIHTHSVHTLELALELGKTFQIPVVATCHYLDFQPLESLAKATKIITISKEMNTKLNLPNYKTVVVENGVDTTLIRPYKKNSQRTAVILARITPAREQAFWEITKCMIEYGWKVLSAGNWYPRGLNISSLNWQVDVSQFLRKADLIIGTGRAIREGMVAGCAACVLGDYFDGLVTPNNVEPLQKYNFSGRAFKITLPHPSLNKMLKTLSEEKKLRELQHFSHRYGQNHFSLKCMVIKTVAVYQTCF